MRTIATTILLIAFAGPVHADSEREQKVLRCFQHPEHLIGMGYVVLTNYCGTPFGRQVHVTAEGKIEIFRFDYGPPPSLYVTMKDNSVVSATK